VMTATPIPRTLAQTLYGDLDLSTLDERPPGRGVLRTAARGLEKLPEIVDYMRSRLQKGRQAYVVYPLVEQSGKLQAKAAESEINAWQQRFSPISCALLHGKMKSSEKEAVMESFRSGKTRVLVTTSVIEVGVDVPNATLLLVENAERFGLAQLHQLRGRIGRGEHPSTCILLEGSGNPAAMERLRILERSNDGFVIAEEDLRIRGAGDILGTEQSGLPPLGIAELPRDANLLETATREARRIAESDPELRTPRHSSLRDLAMRCADYLGPQ
jgi:ATP-dependent DNA helicase RecG